MSIGENTTAKGTQGMSLSVRLRLISISTIFFGFLLLAVVISINDYRNKKENLAQEIHVLAQIAAARSAAATAFSDKAAAQDNLNSLLTQIDIDYACIHNKLGLLAFAKAPHLNISDKTDCQKYSHKQHFENNYLYVSETILLNDRKIGTITVRANMRRIMLSLVQTLSILIIASFITIIMVYFFSSLLLEKAIQPIKELKDVTQAISKNNDYRIRALTNRQDETGILVKSFNEMLEMIEQKDRLKTLFFSNMNHEIRSPLNGLLGIIQLLETTELNQEQEKYLDIAKKSGQHMLTLINDILDFSKLDEKQMSIEVIPCNLLNLVYDCINPMAIRAEEKSLDLFFNISPTAPTLVHTDPTRLKQVITNLLNNAIKFCDSGSVGIMLEDKDGGYRLTISDTGIGIAKDKIESLFTPFKQAEASTTRRFGGTGLGLSIAKNITTLLQGEIHVSSTLDSGTTFTIDFPHTKELDIPFMEHAQSFVRESDLSHICVNLIAPKNRDIQSMITLIERLKLQLDITHYEDHAEGTVESPYPSTHSDTTIFVLPNNLEQAETLIETYHWAGLHIGLVLGPLQLETRFNRKLNAIDGQLHYMPLPIHPSHYIQKVLELVNIKISTTEQENNHQLNNETKTKRNPLVDIYPFEGMRVLVAEDNSVNQTIIRKILIKLNIEVTLVENGFECLELLKNSEKVFDVLLLDCDMPIMDGFSTAKMIRSHKIVNTVGRPLPIIALTGRTQSEDLKLCLTSGMNYHLAKPIDREQLCKTLLKASAT